MAGPSIDVEAVIDGQKIGGFTLSVVLIAVLVLVADGYDVQVMSFAAPSLAKTWHIANKSALAPVLTASLVGILVGAQLFGWLGDRIGRKGCIVLGSVAYGLTSLACLTAHDLTGLALLRFLTGIGLGGVMPNAIAIAAELAPRRLRAGFASIIAVGITLGGVIPGLIVAQLPPGPSFRTLFLVGGLLPLAIAALVAVALPESLAFLVRRGRDGERIARIVRRIDASVRATADSIFVVPAPPAAEAKGFKALFAGPLALTTPLLWVMFAATLLSIYLLTSWMPLLLGASGFSARQAALINSLFQAGGVAGCILVSLLLGRLGVKLIAALFLLCLISMAVVARASLPGAGLAVAIAICGLCLIGLQGALNGAAGLAYPTTARARGLGLALGVGRIGSVVGPLVAGAMVASGASSARDLFLLPLAPLAVGALASLLVARRLNLREAAGSVA